MDTCFKQNMRELFNTMEKDTKRRIKNTSSKVYFYLSASLIPLNSSIQHTPPSARTKAPASRCHCPPSRLAATVRPALVEPIPVVRTDRWLILLPYFSSWLFPVPKNKLMKSNRIQTWNWTKLFSLTSPMSRIFVLLYPNLYLDPLLGVSVVLIYSIYTWILY